MIIKCKMCGGDLEFREGMTVCECEFCGTTQTIPQVDNEKKLNLFNRANRLRMASEFDKAASVYESIVAEFPEEAEAYWGLCLCAYGIEYVDDPASGKKMPTCHRTRQTSIMDDSNFDMACENADAVAKKIYREEAKEIDRLQRDILRIVAGEAPYDVFICYKETGADGGRTQDSVLAQDIYDALTAKGLKVFFARITLEDKLGQQYEPYIYAALHSAKVMLAIGTQYEHFDAVWVKNEWSRFLDMMKTDRQKTLIPCYKDIDAYDIPKEFRNLQAQDMSKLGWLQDLTRGVLKLCDKQPAASQTVVQQVQVSSNAAALLKRGQIYLQDGDFAQAASYFERVLDEDPENAQAYLGKFLSQLQVTTLEEAEQFLIVPDSYKDLERAIRFARGEDKKRLDAFEQYSDRKYYLSRLVKGLDQYAYNREGQEIEQQCNELYREGTEEAFDEIISLHLKAIEHKLNPKVFSRSGVQQVRQQKEMLSVLAKDCQAHNALYLGQAVGIRELPARVLLENMAAKGAIEQHSGFFCVHDAREKREKIKTYEDALAKMQQARQQKLISAAEKAQRLFEGLGNYRDAQAKAVECSGLQRRLQEEMEAHRARQYESAMAFMNKGAYDKAEPIFLELKDYNDSPAQLEICRRKMAEAVYNEACALMNQRKWTEAIALFSSLGDHKNSRKLCEQCREEIKADDYRTAEQLMSQRKWDAAIHAFCALKSFRDSAARADECRRLKEEEQQAAQRRIEMEMQKQAAAAARKKRMMVLFLVLIVLAIAAVAVYVKVVLPANNYKAAEELYAQGDYINALSAYRKVGNYESSMERQRSIISSYAGKISAGEDHLVGVKKDGTVLAVGSNYYGQCDLGGWTDIVAVSAGSSHTLGLKKDGTVVAAGNNHNGQCDVQEWTDIIAVSAGESHSLGLKKDGTVVAVGSNDLFGQCDVSSWKDIVDISAGNLHSVGVQKNGKVVGAGNYSYFASISKLTDIVDIETRMTGTVALTEEGVLWNDVSWTDVVSIYADGISEMALRADGTVLFDGMYISERNSPDTWKDILAMDIGGDHVVYLKTDGRVVDICNSYNKQYDINSWNLLK